MLITPRKRALALLSCCLLAGVAVLLFCVVQPVRPPTPPAVSLLGFTNVPASGPSAIFVIRNLHDRPIDGVWCTPQVKSNSLWPQGILFSQTNAFLLQPKQTTRVLVPVPSGGDAWPPQFSLSSYTNFTEEIQR